MSIESNEADNVAVHNVDVFISDSAGPTPHRIRQISTESADDTSVTALENVLCSGFVISELLTSKMTE